MEETMPIVSLTPYLSAPSTPDRIEPGTAPAAQVIRPSHNPPADTDTSERRPDTVKPWCNYSVHRTNSDRKSAGSKRRRRPIHRGSKRRFNEAVEQWWQQR
jgi:hypothetical protein